MALSWSAVTIFVCLALTFFRPSAEEWLSPDSYFSSGKSEEPKGEGRWLSPDSYFSSGKSEEPKGEGGWLSPGTYLSSGKSEEPKSEGGWLSRDSYFSSGKSEEPKGEGGWLSLGTYLSLGKSEEPKSDEGLLSSGTDPSLKKSEKPKSDEGLSSPGTYPSSRKSEEPKRDPTAESKQIDNTKDLASTTLGRLRPETVVSLGKTENPEREKTSNVEEDMATEDFKMQQHCSCQEDLVDKGAKAFLQRFISLFLIVSDLNTKEKEIVNTVELTLSISDTQLNILSQFAKEGDLNSVPLRKLDEIFSAIFVKQFNLIPKFTNFERLVNNVPDIQVGSYFVNIILPTLIFVIIFTRTRNVRQSFILLTPIVFLLSFITTALRLYEEAQLKQYEEIKHANIPSDCHGRSHWFSSTSKSECLRHMVAHHINPNLGVTPIKVIGAMFGESLADLMKHFGSGTFEFLGLFEEISFFSRFWILPIACVLLYLFLAMVFLVVTGGSINLPFFMGCLSFHNPHRHNNAVPDLSSNASAGFKRLESQPSTSSLTLNFNHHVPPNVHEIIKSVSQSVSCQSPYLYLDQQINQPLPITTGLQHSNVSAQDQLGAGDFAPAGASTDSGISRPVNKAAGRAYPSHNRKRLHKKFSQLEAKYKAGGKFVSESISRPRHNSF